EGTVKVWDSATGQATLTFKTMGFVTSVAFSPDGKHIASDGDDHTVKVWDAVTGKETLTLKGHTAGINSVAWSPDGKRLASGSSDSDRTVKVWDAVTGKETLTLKGHTNGERGKETLTQRQTRGVNSVAWSPDGKRIISGGDDHLVKVWDADT